MNQSAAGRGFLFGLTMTELMILFVFLLALLIGKTAAESEALREELSASEEREAEGVRAQEALQRLAPVIEGTAEPEGFTQAVLDLVARLERLTVERDGLAARYEPVTRHLNAASEEELASLDELLLRVGAALASSPDRAATLGRLAENVAARDELASCTTELVTARAETTELREALESRAHLQAQLDAVTEELDRQRPLLANAEGLQASLTAVAGEVARRGALLQAAASREAELHRAADEAGRRLALLNDVQARRSELDYELENCRRQVGFQQARLNADKGSDKVACWVDENGRTEYLFDVTLTPRGFTVAAAWPDERDERALAIPGVEALTNASHAPASFMGGATKVLGWSNERDCRHYVRIRDRVGSDKELYKRRLRQAENYFYKYLVQG